MEGAVWYVRACKDMFVSPRTYTNVRVPRRGHGAPVGLDSGIRPADRGGGYHGPRLQDACHACISRSFQPQVRSSSIDVAAVARRQFQASEQYHVAADGRYQSLSSGACTPAKVPIGECLPKPRAQDEGGDLLVLDPTDGMLVLHRFRLQKPRLLLHILFRTPLLLLLVLQEYLEMHCALISVFDTEAKTIGKPKPY
jgi:hypothetical protein